MGKRREEGGGQKMGRRNKVHFFRGREKLIILGKELRSAEE